MTRAPLFRSVSDRIWALTRAKIDRLVYTNGGLGDELMLTAIARAARECGEPVHVVTNLPAVWRSNDDPASVQIGVDRWQYSRLRGWISTEIVHLAYDTCHGGRHIAQQMADHLGIELRSGWTPRLAAIGHRRRNSRQLVLQTSCRGARYAATTKEWAQENWVRLVSMLGHFELVQIGTIHDAPLAGTQDLRGRTTLAEAADIIATAAAFVGLESGLMHVAAAVATPAVIVYGGRSIPAQTGYPFQRHITRAPECVGCGLNNACPHGMVCMDIPAEEVADAIYSLLR